MMKSEKQARGSDNLKWGHEAEQIAAEYFLTQGYTIRERNWTCGKIEIDLIAEKDRTMVFVEVKARNGNQELPEDAVDSRKRLKMIRGADIYLRQQEYLYYYRFDIFAVSGDRESYTVNHIPDAFLPSVNKR